jgi:cytochrome c peroxidase
VRCAVASIHQLGLHVPEATLERRIGRRIDPHLADLGRLLWFDTITGPNNDNTCAGCHSPTNGFGDTQSIAIGIENKGAVSLRGRPKSCGTADRGTK